MVKIIHSKEHSSIFETEDSSLRLYLSQKGVWNEIALIESQQNLRDSDFGSKKKQSYKSRKFLGLDSEGSVSYYVGAEWLVEKECALIVSPKIQHLNYLKMFIDCLENPTTENHIQDIYHIDLDKPSIKIESDTFELTPLLIAHFLKIVKQIIHKGLKKDYVWKEENLSSKVKGKILLNQNQKRNGLTRRLDRNYCRFQEFSVDCLENRVLKKALIFISNYLNHSGSVYTELRSWLQFCLPAFQNVSDQVNSREIQGARCSGFYKNYIEAIQLAKLVLRRFSYSIQQARSTYSYPPFSINMALLFEMYVYTKLYSTFGKSILFQYGGKYGEVDFLYLSKRTIIDTKYKPKYSADKKYEISDIRQLSGYARDTGVLKKVGFDVNSQGEVPCLPCLIIYPDINGVTDIESDDVLFSEKIEQFYGFYKLGIKLPANEF